MVDLHPCPFCGGEAKHMTMENPDFNKHEGVYFIYCTTCECATPTFSTPEQPIEVWNRRVA